MKAGLGSKTQIDFTIRTRVSSGHVHRDVYVGAISSHPAAVAIVVVVQQLSLRRPVGIGSLMVTALALIDGQFRERKGMATSQSRMLIIAQSRSTAARVDTVAVVMAVTPADGAGEHIQIRWARVARFRPRTVHRSVDFHLK